MNQNVELYRQSPRGRLEQARLELSLAKARFDTARASLRRSRPGKEGQEAWVRFEAAEKAFRQARRALASIEKEVKGGKKWP